MVGIIGVGKIYSILTYMYYLNRKKHAFATLFNNFRSFSANYFVAATRKA